MKNRILLLIIGVVSGVAAVWGTTNSLSGNASGYCSFLWWLGLFTWDDAMVLGGLLFVASVVLWFKNQPVLTGLFLSSYATLRSFIEILYNLNAQFSPISRPWESQLPSIAAQYNLKLVELFVVGQIFFTAVCVVSFLILLSYIKKYLAFS